MPTTSGALQRSSVERRADKACRAGHGVHTSHDMPCLTLAACCTLHSIPVPHSKQAGHNHAHIVQGAHARSGALLGRINGQPKVTQPQAAFGCEEHILRLDVAAQTGVNTGKWAGIDGGGGCPESSRACNQPSSCSICQVRLPAPSTPSLQRLRSPVHDVVGVQEGEGEQQRHHHIAAHVCLCQQPPCTYQPAVQIAACKRGLTGRQEQAVSDKQA